MVTKTVDVFLADKLLQSYEINDWGVEGPNGNTAATDRDYIQGARGFALRDKLITEETAEHARFVVRQ
jgi:hypothetical protein